MDDVEVTDAEISRMALENVIYHQSTKYTEQIFTHKKEFSQEKLNLVTEVGGNEIRIPIA